MTDDSDVESLTPPHEKEVEPEAPPVEEVERSPPQSPSSRYELFGAKNKIKIESHTDSRGSDAHNLTLSDNRAKSTQAYIISKGISPDRIESAIGYGETRLKVNCPNGVKCSEEQHSVNRRSDFIIISK